MTGPASHDEDVVARVELGAVRVHGYGFSLGKGSNKIQRNGIAAQIIARDIAKERY